MVRIGRRTIVLVAALLVLVVPASPRSAELEILPTACEGDIDPPPPDSMTYIFGGFAEAVSTTSGSSASSSCDWGVEPPYEGPVYANEEEAAAADPPAPAQVPVALPTWPNRYDWPNGHGYAGWHSSSSRANAYGIAQNLGGSAGLWLWPAGNQQYTGADFAEWTYTAPGTTRIATVNLSFAYRNKLLAHHCLVVGLRTPAGVVSQNEWCTPATPPDSQRDIPVTLVDPSSNPTSKTLFFRIRVDCKGATSCSKSIPSLDPLQTAGTARLKAVDMTLVDDDVPVVEPVHEEFDQQAERYAFVVRASDGGGGVSALSVEHIGYGLLHSSQAACDPGHLTPSLDARICPEAHSVAATVDTTLLPEGSHEFVATSHDIAGNSASTTWTLVVNRSPSVIIREEEAVFDPPVSAAEALVWASEAGVTPIHLITEFSFSDGPFAVGYLVEPELTPAETTIEHGESVRSMFEDLASAGEDRWSSYGGQALVNRMTFSGTPAAISAATDDTRASVMPADVRSAQGSAEDAAATTNSCGQIPWWPQAGTIATRPSTSPRYQGQRFVFQSFTWTSERLANLKCPDDVTYEAESIYYNYDRQRYLGAKKSWATNMPKGYFDTNFLDAPNEINYAVGTSDARLLQSGRVYWTLIRTLPGNAASDRGKVQGQRGDRTPSACHRTWCIFADETAELLPAWEHRVPGFNSWSGGRLR